MSKEEIYLLLIIVLNINYISSYINLPFYFSSKDKKSHETKFELKLKNYFNYYINNLIYSRIKVNDKLVNFRLTMDSFATFISDKIYEPKNKENQVIKIDKNFTLDYINLNKVKIINDSFYFQSIENNNKKELNIFNNYTFFQVNKYTNDSIEKEDAIIGLNRVKGSPYFVLKEDSDHWGCKFEEDTNLINQLKSRKLINTSIFSIKYDSSKEEGEVIIGDFPHEYEQKNFVKENLFYNRVLCYTCPPFNYYSRFTELFYNNQSLITTKTFQISIDHGFIEAPLSEKKHFDSFFQEYKDFCKEENINNIYVFYCKKDVIKNLNSINFYFANREIYEIGLLNEFNLEFNYNDLFIEEKGKNNNIYYFQIIFKNNEDWIFGKPLFKKYRVIFDQNRKMYGIYRNINIQNHEDSKKENKTIDKLTIFLIITILLGVVVIVESFYLIKNIFIQSNRNKRANELTDEYDYDAHLNNKETIKNAINP